MNYYDKLRELLLKVKRLLLRYKDLEETLEDEEDLGFGGEEDMRKYPHNYEDFPFNIFVPDKITIDDEEYIRYRAKFNSLHDLFNYLSSDPRINGTVFETLHSVSNGVDFAGVPYEDALEELEGAPRSEYRDFLRLSDRLNDDAMGYVQEFGTVKSPGGGYIDIPSYASGDPLCYRISRSTYTPKFIRVNVALSYNWTTTKEQVLNRALIIVALVNAFERAGYIVEVNTFEMSRVDDEIVQIDVNIKNNDQTFNRASLYKSLCYVEFLRRLLFRVLETMDVREWDWGHGYGHTCDEDLVRKVKRMGDGDIFFDQPDEMGIDGKSITKDFDAVLRCLNLGDKIDVDRAKKDFNREVKSLRKTIK